MTLLIKLVDQILDAKKQPPSSPFSKGELPDADTSALEQQINEIVCKLCNFTPDEIAVVEGKRLEIILAKKWLIEYN
jgi:hypothetical protein